MDGKQLALVVLAIVLAFLTLAVLNPPLPKACFENGSCLSLEVAKTAAEQEKGLMDRAYLGPNSGMLFVFDTSANQVFWMKDTLIPLDMIFLDANGTIVGIVENAQPCEADPCPTYSISAPSSLVIEANAGFAREKALRSGQKVKIENVSFSG